MFIPKLAEQMLRAIRKGGRAVRRVTVKELISQYALSTNQNSSLAQNMQLKDANNPANNFIRREFGGRVIPGLDYVVGERRPEVFSPDTPGHIYPSVDHYERARELVQARLRAQAQASAQSAAAPSPGGQSSQKGQGGGVIPPSLVVAIHGTLAR